MAMAAKEDMILIVNKEIKTNVKTFLYDQKISGENVSTLSNKCHSLNFQAWRLKSKRST